jgi:hypothetical protein
MDENRRSVAADLIGLSFVRALNRGLKPQDAPV